MELAKETTPKKHKFLDIETKLELLHRISQGESMLKLAKEYGVGKTTVRDIYTRREVILQYAARAEEFGQGSTKRKTLRMGENIALDDAVFSWYVHRRATGKEVADPDICQKALELNKDMRGPSQFKASTGWLKNFKIRHNIDEVLYENREEENDFETASELEPNFEKLLSPKCLLITTSGQLNLKDEHSLDSTKDTEEESFRAMSCVETSLKQYSEDQEPQPVAGEGFKKESVDAEVETVQDFSLSRESESSVKMEDVRTAGTSNTAPVTKTFVETRINNQNTFKPSVPVLQNKGVITLGNDYVDLKSIVKRLEKISDKMVEFTGLDHQYETFARDLAYMMRGIPHKNLLILKQRLISMVMCAKTGVEHPPDKQNDSILNLPEEVCSNSRTNISTSTAQGRSSMDTTQPMPYSSHLSPHHSTSVGNHDDPTDSIQRFHSVDPKNAEEGYKEETDAVSDHNDDSVSEISTQSQNVPATAMDLTLQPQSDEHHSSVPSPQSLNTHTPYKEQSSESSSQTRLAPMEDLSSDSISSSRSKRKRYEKEPSTSNPSVKQATKYLKKQGTRTSNDIPQVQLELLETPMGLRAEAVVSCPVGEARNALRLSGCHFVRPLPKRLKGEKRKQKRCFVCAHSAKREPQRKDTAYECAMCEVPLCVFPCFEQYHTMEIF